jgi:hypothetical protein
VLGIVCASTPMACTTEPRAAAEGRAIDGIAKLGGTFERDRDADGGPVVKLDLAGKPIGDADLEVLKALTRLNTLSLRQTRVTDAGLALLKTTGKLRSLDLDACRVTDAGLAQLGALTSLRGLYLAGTKVTDSGLAHLSPLRKLWGLSLRDTEVSDAGLVHLRGLTKLRLLDLTNTRVTDDGIAKLRKDLPQARIIARAGGSADRRALGIRPHPGPAQRSGDRGSAVRDSL